MSGLRAVKTAEYLSAPANHPGPPKAVRCLAVGIEASRSAMHHSRFGEMRGIRFCDLGRAGLGPSGPETVLAPLFSDEFDALDLLERLAALKFRGVVMVVAPRLPNRLIVLRELQSAAGKRGMSIDLVDG